MIDKQIIANNIEKARIEKQMTIVKLREELGSKNKPFSQSQYYRIINGAQLPPISMLLKMSIIFNKSIDYFLEDCEKGED